MAWNKTNIQNEKLTSASKSWIEDVISSQITTSTPPIAATPSTQDKTKQTIKK